MQSLALLSQSEQSLQIRTTLLFKFKFVLFVYTYQEKGYLNTYRDNDKCRWLTPSVNYYYIMKLFVPLYERESIA